MLPRSHTLRSGEFAQILKEGKTIRSSLFVLKFRKNLKNPAQLSRFSVIVSKKVAPSAVDRNTIRRRVYGALETFYPSIKEGFEGVVTVVTPVIDTDAALILNELKSVFSQASLI